MIQQVSITKNGSLNFGISSSSIDPAEVFPFVFVSFTSLQCLNSGNVSKQNITIDNKITTTEKIAISRAAVELSGYSKINQTLLWNSFSGRGFSSSLINHSSPRYFSIASPPKS